MNRELNAHLPRGPAIFSYDLNEMGRAIGGFAWEATPLGPLRSWPASLTANVRMMLGQRHAVSLFWGPELTMLYNDAYAPMLGAKETHALGQPFREIWSDIWEDVLPFVEQALSGHGTFSEELRLVMTRNGFEEETFWRFSYSPVYDDSGNVAGLINVTVDVTDVVKARRNQQVMQAELQHRIRNILTVASMVVSSSLRNAASIEEARETVGARIAALAKAQGLLTEVGQAAEIRRVVTQSIGAHLDGTERLRLNGDALRLNMQQAIGLSLALYELSTNAVKYGALSTEGGVIEITWSVGDDKDFRFQWIERGGPPVTKPARSGFGSKLMTQIVPAYFSGSGGADYHPDGLRYELSGKVAD